MLIYKKEVESMDEIPYEFQDPIAYLKERYGVETDSDLEDAIDSDCE